MAQLQRMFAEAIVADDAPIPATVRAASGPATTSRFAVYRNNVVASLVGAVGARYPATRRLLWPETFDRIAHLYVLSEPPRSPVLLEYAESFPQFLRTIGWGPAADYLADVAELEAARTRAYHAVDAEPVAKDAFAALAADDLPDLRITLHPSVTLFRSRFPVVTIWQANFYANESAIGEWREETALIARPHLEVEVHRLPPGVYEFLVALAAGHPIGEAVSQALAATPSFDLAQGFNTMIATDIVATLDAGGRPAGISASLDG